MIIGALKFAGYAADIIFKAFMPSEETPLTIA